MINIDNIVKVDFSIQTKSLKSGSYNTVVYVIGSELSNSLTGALCESIDDVKGVTSDADVITNATLFFNNGGVRLLLIPASAYTLDGFKTDIATARTFANDFIYVVISNQIAYASSYYSSSIMLSILQYVESLATPYTVRILLTTNSLTFVDTNSLSEYSVGIKYSTLESNSKLVDAALVIGAYFSKIDLSGNNTIKDYCYTTEVGLKAENVSQSNYEALVTNYNFEDRIGTKIVNFGGNLSNGVALSTDFATIAIENDVCYSTLAAMLGKQYLTDSGLTNIVAAINSQMQRYKINGFLSLGAQYSGEDLNTTYNGKNFKLIAANTTLPQGFYIATIPMTYLTASDKSAKKFTPIYVIMETQSGARVVEISGIVR